MTPGQERLPTCREIVELITDYLEGNLPPDVRGRVEQHLTWCRGCRNYLEQMPVTIGLAGRLAEDSLHPDVRDELVRAFRGWRS
jgi:anti-sigma factor RsiW